MPVDPPQAASGVPAIINRSTSTKRASVREPDIRRDATRTVRATKAPNKRGLM